jgi:cytochrome c oxidase cbb3-type subunit 3
MTDDTRPAAKPGPEPDHILDHNYDGIQEYDNPLPRWWTTIFWLTIVFSVLYVLNVPGIGKGPGRIADYQRDMAKAAEQRAALAAKAPAPSEMTDAALLAMSRDAARLAKGKERFTTTCAACHRADGGGLIGPNLTDDFWIHGGKPTEILKTVTNGVPDKGMPTWSQTMNADEIATVVAYVLTLHGTHPPDPKEPQGQKVEAPGEHAP